MKKFTGFIILGWALLSAIPAGATTFDFTNCSLSGLGTCNNDYSNSSPFTETVGGITVTATAFATASVGTGSTSAGNIGQYGGNGLGVCSAAEGSNCPGSAPEHQIDNASDYEFVLLTFSAAVNLQSIVLANYGTTGSSVDMDMSYWKNLTAAQLSTFASTGAFSVASATNVFCGDSGEGASNQNATCVAGGMTDSLSGTGVTSLVIAAYVGSTASPADNIPDYFKIQDLTVAAATPEPATFALLGVALAGLGLYGRKRKLNR
jgi:PEP-CTERM motif